MSAAENNGIDIGKLTARLSEKDGMAREKARKELVKIGGAAVGGLLGLMENSESGQARWEAAKALCDIGDKRAIGPFVRALEDDYEELAWIAAEALKKQGAEAWPELLDALRLKGSKSKLLRDGAHHILKGQKQPGYEDMLKKLVDALEIEGTPESIEPAADEILKKMGKAG